MLTLLLYERAKSSRIRRELIPRSSCRTREKAGDTGSFVVATVEVQNEPRRARNLPQKAMNLPCLRSLAAAVVYVIAVHTALASTSTVSYTYDAAGRLVGVNYGGTSNTAFAYDPNGNLLARTNTVNGFVPLAGQYNGRVAGNTPTALNSGTISVKVMATGSFTGTVTLAGKKYLIQGNFDPVTGHADPIQITRAAPLTPLTLNLTLDLANGTEQLTGMITGGETASATASLDPFDKKSNPLPSGLVGTYTALFLPTQAGVTIPQGRGFGTVIVSADGSVRLVGTLADKSTVSQGSALSRGAVWPLFGPLKNQGFISGDVTFENTPGTSDFDGTLTWIKPVTAGPLYPAAFDTDLDMIGSTYTKPAKNQRVLDFTDASPNATFTATGGNLSASPLTEDVTLTVPNKIVGPANDAHKLKLTIALPSGLVTGSFLDGATSHSLFGVIFQKQESAGGFFPGTSESGPFSLTSKP